MSAKTECEFSSRIAFVQVYSTYKATYICGKKMIITGSGKLVPEIQYMGTRNQQKNGLKAS